MANDAKRLINARKAKNDEFYTQLTDIEKEVGHYKEYFKGKTVLCNCDDPKESNFFRYFALNFKYLGLKKLITTHFEADKPSYALIVDRDINDDGKIDLEDAVKIPLKQNYEQGDLFAQSDIKSFSGDFRSPECIEFLKEADIICTNPPFSLFREYVAQLIEYDKKFLIIGNQNSITYKEIFKLIEKNKIWLGITMDSSNRWFSVPNHYEQYHKIEDGIKYAFVAGVVWFTNLPNKKRTEKIILYKTYVPNEYPKYDNFDAIEVSKVKDIPIDYNGIMGVPISFLHKYNPKQFEIIGMIAPGKNNKNYLCEPLINGVYKYRRLAIIKKGN